MGDHDFLDEIEAEWTAKDPEFPRLVREVEARRIWARKLAALRAAQKLTQTQVAAKMGTSTSVVSKLESGIDAKISTVQRYLAALKTSLPVPTMPVASATKSGGRKRAMRA